MLIAGIGLNEQSCQRSNRYNYLKTNSIMKTQKKSLVVWVALTVLVSSAALAQPHHVNRSQCLEFVDNLTEQQEQQIMALRKGHFQNLIRLRSELTEVRGSYKLLMTGDNDNNVELKENIDKQVSLIREIKLEKLQHEQEVRAVLIDDQKLQYDLHLLERPKRNGPSRHRI
jgi:Spy/CpxP family protein refolding chaperone